MACAGPAPPTSHSLPQVLLALLDLVTDYAAVDLLLAEGKARWPLCLFTRDPEHYTLHWRRGEAEVVAAPEPVDDQPEWTPPATERPLAADPDPATTI